MAKKVIWIPDEDIPMGNATLKAGHRYTVYAAPSGDKWTRIAYRGVNLIVDKSQIIQIDKKPSKPRSITPTDYKNFSDLCFEVGIRYRDGWRSVISGKQFEEGDWARLHAGHGLSRKYWATRHNGMNCYAITAAENELMSLNDPDTIDRFWRAVARIHGGRAADELRKYKPAPVKLDLAYLREECERCYQFLYLQTRGNPRRPSEIVKWRAEKLPARTRVGILAVLDTME